MSPTLNHRPACAHLPAALAVALAMLLPAAASASSGTGLMPPAPHSTDLIFPGVRHGAPLEILVSEPYFAELGSRPVVFVHGLGGGPADFDTLRVRFEAAGVPADRIHAVHFTETSVLDSNRDNALFLAEFVREVLSRDGASHVDIVAHSMGGLTARYYLKVLGGTRYVRSFITLGTMHLGFPDDPVSSPCNIPEDVEALAELCRDAPFITLLNRRDATPGPTRYVSIYSTTDDVVPAALSHLEGAHNVAVHGLDHAGRFGLLEDRGVFDTLSWYLTTR